MSCDAWKPYVFHFSVMNLEVRVQNVRIIFIKCPDLIYWVTFKKHGVFLAALNNRLFVQETLILKISLAQCRAQYSGLVLQNLSIPTFHYLNILA